MTLVAFVLAQVMRPSPSVQATSPLLAPAPRQILGSYDYFGQVLSPAAAADLVKSNGLNPNNPRSYDQVGAVKITQPLLDAGEKIFLNREIGDRFGLQRVLGFQLGIARILPEVGVAIAQQKGQPTSNLTIKLLRDLQLGSTVFPKGTPIRTGLDLAPKSFLPIGLKLPGDITCAICHVAVSPSGKQLKGVPNEDVAAQILVALSPNSAAGFARLNLNPLNPAFQGNGKTILDSQGQLVKLPDPQKFEQAFDDLLLAVPFGHFESSPDTINNTTQIPTVFTHGTAPYGWSGESAIGPFGGLSVLNNSVHSSEVNLLAAGQRSAETIGVDPEVYLGVVLQNAADRRLRIPDGVKPSEWLRKVAPDVNRAELQDQVALPGTGRYPRLQPSLLAFNGLGFSPPTRDRRDIARGKFFFANNAMSAWQDSLQPPANQSASNRDALGNGSVDRGAQVFQDANCASCHIPPFFTDKKIHPIAELGTNPARGESRLATNSILVAPQLYSFDTSVPVRGNAKVLDVPAPQKLFDDDRSLPRDLLPDGGYDTPSLLGLYVSAPYLHDGGVAVSKNALAVGNDGSFQVVDPKGLGLSGTLSQGIPADAANSLRALLDRQLRSSVIQTNQLNPALQVSNLDGTGHGFYVDGTAGFSQQQQQDLINFLLALDDNPAQF
ncbi:di-heme oxidoredictase family protein [Romeriopsis navalis]|uniref:di-heme oxidoredictase family protein n=1 Tax=Romeriopsis navalis TaxID=2992132 RepID=UPI0021F8AB47|nr:di-heme oxidoredictase family protein [Romeriopsis navalis]